MALADDYDVVLVGVAHLFDRYRDRILVAEIDANKPLHDAVDIVLYDSFAQPESDHEEISVLVNNPGARRVVVYTWNFHPDRVASARSQGARGYLSEALPARDLVAALEAVHAGEVVVSEPPRRAPSNSGLNWPGRSEGLTDRESKILALITQGKSSAGTSTVSTIGARDPECVLGRLGQRAAPVQKMDRGRRVPRFFSPDPIIASSHQ